MSSLRTEAGGRQHTSSPFSLKAVRLGHLSKSYKKQRLLQLQPLGAGTGWHVQRPQGLSGWPISLKTGSCLEIQSTQPRPVQDAGLASRDMVSAVVVGLLPCFCSIFETLRAVSYWVRKEHDYQTCKLRSYGPQSHLSQGARQPVRGFRVFPSPTSFPLS